MSHQTFEGSDKWQLYEHDRITLFPPAFNELRERIHDQFPTLWMLVGGMMVHDHEHFIEYMNAATDCNVDPCDHSIEESCKIWMAALEKIQKAATSGIILPSGDIYHGSN